MSAFNWIEFEEICPSCKENSAIKAQTHMCSDFDGSPTERFHDRVYRIGQMMAWWDKNDARYDSWKDSNIIRKENEDRIRECCYSECLRCRADLYVIIEFKQCSPTQIESIGLELDWPIEYLK